MWPWTHALLGYVCYSLAVRATFRRRPADVPAILAVVAAVLPDLVDKPLAWTFDVVTTGYGPAHSLLVGVPLAAVVGAWAWRVGRREAGLGFLVGYASHLLGDLLFQYADEGELVASVVLWPVSPTAPDSAGSLVEQVVFFLVRYANQIQSGEATPYLVATLALAGGVVVLWVVDGTPGVRLLLDRD